MRYRSQSPGRARGKSGLAAFSLLVLLSVTLNLSQAHAQATAPPAGTTRIAGRVLGPEGEPAPYAGVALIELKRATMTDEAGRFVLDRVPDGRWTLRFDSPAYGQVTRTVEVAAGVYPPIEVRFLTGKVHAMPPIEVSGDRKKARTDGAKAYSKDRATIAEHNALSVQEVLTTTPGVVASADGIHVDGGRVTEVKTHISGVPSNNAMTAGNADISLLAVSSVSLLSGGMDAEFGDALSAIVQIETREGGAHFGGDLRWDTDRFGDPTKTFDNYDRFTIGAGGPLPIRNLTYFATYEGTFSDAYPRTTLTTPTTTLLDFVQLGNRQSNQIKTSLKLVWRAPSSGKLSLEMIHNHAIVTPYDHAWSRNGYVQTTLDTLHGDEQGTITGTRPRYGSWSGTAVDSTYQPANLPDHVPTRDSRYQQWTAAWVQSLSRTTVWTARLSSLAFDEYNGVGRKQPWEYDTQAPYFWTGNQGPGTENNPYFATHGDFPVYARSRSQTWVAKTDLATERWKAHRAKAGIEVLYNRLENLALLGPNLETNGLPGQTRSSFTNFNPEGSIYVKDRWEFEGLVVNAGLRYEAFAPGQQIPDGDLPSGKRIKQQLSPRLGIAFPISDKDVMSFYYGWVYQTPPHTFLYQDRGAMSSVPVRGNPDLEPETNVSYQAGIQHLFTRDVSAQFSVFFRDIFGLISTRTRVDEAGNVIPYYANDDYASARGFEASIIKSFSHKFSAELNYTYMLASGVASDPNSALQFINGTQLYLPISERYLDWDQRHTVSLQTVLREPGRWGMHLSWEYGSGVPFTPIYRNNRRPDPALENSRRRPARVAVNLDASKYYRIWGRPVTFFVDARNLLDSQNIREISPAGAGNPNVNQGQDDYAAYFTETGRAGGAYLQDVNADGIADWVPLNDPSVFEEGRAVRLGVSTSF